METRNALKMDGKLKTQENLYGVTAIELFEKSKLEANLGIERRNSLFSGLKWHLICLEILVVSVTSLYVSWCVHGENPANFRTQDIVRVLNGTKNTFNGLWNSNNLSTLNVHGIIYMVVFGLLLIHISMVNIIFNDCKSICVIGLTLILELLTFFLFFAAWLDITSMQKVSLELSIHSGFSHLVFFFFVMLVVSSGVRLANGIYPNLKNARLIGKILLWTQSEGFVAAQEKLLHGLALLTIVSGFFEYMFCLAKANRSWSHMDISMALFKIDSTNIQVLVCLLMNLYAVVMAVIICKHYLQIHTHCITEEQFQKHFLQFKHLYESHSTLHPEEPIPKLTIAVRKA